MKQIYTMEEKPFINSLESITGLLKSLKVPPLYKGVGAGGVYASTPHSPTIFFPADTWIFY